MEMQGYSDEDEAEEMQCSIEDDGAEVKLSCRRGCGDAETQP